MRPRSHEPMEVSIGLVRIPLRARLASRTVCVQLRSCPRPTQALALVGLLRSFLRTCGRWPRGWQVGAGCSRLVGWTPLMLPSRRAPGPGRRMVGCCGLATTAGSGAPRRLSAGRLSVSSSPRRPNDPGHTVCVFRRKMDGDSGRTGHIRLWKQFPCGQVKIRLNAGFPRSAETDRL